LFRAPTPAQGLAMVGNRRHKSEAAGFTTPGIMPSSAVFVLGWHTGERRRGTRSLKGPGGTAGTLDKQGYLAVQKAFFAAAPDYHGTLANVRDEGDTGYGTVTASGTQTQPLALPGLPPIPATGKHFSTTFDTTVTWHGDRISTMSLQQVGPGLLDQLGIQLPG
jgi:hypothetical protein